MRIYGEDFRDKKNKFYCLQKAMKLSLVVQKRQHASLSLKAENYSLVFLLSRWQNRDVQKN